MKKITCFIAVLVTIAAVPAWGSKPPPEFGNDPSNESSDAKNITIRWNDTDHDVSVLIFSGAFQQDGPSFPYGEKQEKQATLQGRKGQVVVVPEPKNKKPEMLTVRQSGSSVHDVQFEDIPDEKLVFWGRTPIKPCTSSPGPDRFKANFRMLDNTTEYEEFRGVFAWTIPSARLVEPNNDVDKLAEVFGNETGTTEQATQARYGYFLNPEGNLAGAEAEPLSQAQGSRVAQCKEYIGGKCEHAYGIGVDPDGESEYFGKHFELDLAVDKDKECGSSDRGLGPMVALPD